MISLQISNTNQDQENQPEQSTKKAPFYKTTSGIVVLCIAGACVLAACIALPIYLNSKSGGSEPDAPATAEDLARATHPDFDNLTAEEQQQLTLRARWDRRWDLETPTRVNPTFGQHTDGLNIEADGLVASGTGVAFIDFGGGVLPPAGVAVYFRQEALDPSQPAYSGYGTGWDLHMGLGKPSALTLHEESDRFSENAGEVHGMIYRDWREREWCSPQTQILEFHKYRPQWERGSYSASKFVTSGTADERYGERLVTIDQDDQLGVRLAPGYKITIVGKCRVAPADRNGLGGEIFTTEAECAARNGRFHWPTH